MVFSILTLHLNEEMHLTWNWISWNMRHGSYSDSLSLNCGFTGSLSLFESTMSGFSLSLIWKLHKDTKSTKNINGHSVAGEKNDLFLMRRNLRFWETLVFFSCALLVQKNKNRPCDSRSKSSLRNHLFRHVKQGYYCTYTYIEKGRDYWIVAWTFIIQLRLQNLGEIQKRRGGLNEIGLENHLTHSFPSCSHVVLFLVERPS